MISRGLLCVCLVALFCGTCLVVAPAQGQVVVDSGYEAYSVHIDWAVVKSEGMLFSYATIGLADVYGGTLCNMSGATIDSATIYGGWLPNYGTIKSADVRGGELYNRNGDATIGTLVLQGGIVSNGSVICEMTYFGGTYMGADSGLDGRIDTLIVAGPVTGGDWRNVGHLVFDSNGKGAITVAATASDSGGLGVSFRSAVTADRIDFTHGTIVLDLTAIVRDGEDWISAVSGLFESGMTLATLFGVSDSGPNSTITGLDALDSLKVLWGDNQPGTILDGGKLAPGWESTGVAGGGFTHNTPEPATLTLLCLSTATLLRRRK